MNRPLRSLHRDISLRGLRRWLWPDSACHGQPPARRFTRLMRLLGSWVWRGLRHRSRWRLQVRALLVVGLVDVT